MPDPHSTFVIRRLPAGLTRRALKSLAAGLEEKATGGRHFTCLLADDAELQRLNRQFLDRDYPTDVLSFPSPGPDGFLGEIAISIDRAGEQARERGHSLEDEVGILLLHGALHLLGMDHEKEAVAMKNEYVGMGMEQGAGSGLDQLTVVVAALKAAT